MRLQLCRPLSIGVFRIFTRQTVFIIQAVAIVVVLCALLVFADWSITVLTAQSVSNENESMTVHDPPLLDFGDTTLSYGIVIDCGSSGSRVFVYCWPPHNGEPRHLLKIRQLHDSNGNPVVMKIEPGLSSYVNKPSESSEHIIQLLKYASVHVPKDRHKETPVYIMATAGLRLLDLRDQEAILNDLRVDLALQFEFLFSPTHVEVISGKQEGIYSWIAINHALGKFGHSMNPEDRLVSVELTNGNKHIRKRTIGILDLGGASLQIAHELRDLQSVDNIDKNLLAEFNLGCTSSDVDHHYRLYINTYLGLGSNEARFLYETQLLSSYNLALQQQNNSSIKPILSDDFSFPTILDVCLPSGHKRNIVRGNLTAVLLGAGDFEACQKKTVSLLANIVKCGSSNETTKCSLNSMPDHMINFHNSEFYGFAEFFYTMEDILKIGGKYRSVTFQKAAESYCATNWSLIERWQSSTEFPRADSNRYRLQCFKSAWMYTVLHEHLHFPRHYRHLTSIQYINKQEVHWTLGALLYKTKYYPLRDIEKHKVPGQQQEMSARPSWSADIDQSYIVFFICTASVLVIILIYIYRRHTTVSPLHRVPTMSYYMIDSDAEFSEGVIRFDRSQSYSRLPFIPTAS